MQSISTSRQPRARLLVVELWGIGDVALAIPFLRTAAEHAEITLVAKPHAASLLNRFCPTVKLITLDAPWTAFRRKYRLLRWPWRALWRQLQAMRALNPTIAVSARPDPRDHALLAMSGAPRRAGFSRKGSRLLLTENLPRPAGPHRADYWSALAQHLGLPPSPRIVHEAQRSTERHVVMHTGAARTVREWPRQRFEDIASRLRAAGWPVTIIDNSLTDLDALIETLARASHFIGNDSGPGHIAATLGVPTFTIFGPQLPELFAPRHPSARWVEGAPCPYKPCFDACRFPQPYCILNVTEAHVWTRLQEWLSA